MTTLSPSDPIQNIAAWLCWFGFSMLSGEYFHQDAGVLGSLWPSPMCNRELPNVVPGRSSDYSLRAAATPTRLTPLSILRIDLS